MIEAMRKALVAGALISLAGFAFVFWAVSRLLPLILEAEASPWFGLVSNVVFLFFLAGTSTAIHLRRRRGKTSAAHR
jgi:hypothetical protein